MGEDNEEKIQYSKKKLIWDLIVGIVIALILGLFIGPFIVGDLFIGWDLMDWSCFIATPSMVIGMVIGRLIAYRKAPEKSIWFGHGLGVVIGLLMVFVLTVINPFDFRIKPIF